MTNEEEKEFTQEAETRMDTLNAKLKTLKWPNDTLREACRLVLYDWLICVHQGFETHCILPIQRIDVAATCPVLLIEAGITVLEAEIAFMKHALEDLKQFKTPSKE